VLGGVSDTVAIGDDHTEAALVGHAREDEDGIDR
jgi:hypothetical protein